MEQVKPVKIEANVMWAFLNKKNDYDTYSVDLCNLSDDAVEALKKIGVTAKFDPDKEDKGRFITCKSKNYEILAVDTHGDTIDVPVGNGSKCRALIGAYEWKFKNRAGVSPSVKKMVITDLIEFRRDADVDEDDDIPL